MSVAAFIASARTEHGMPHTIDCRTLGVPQSWFSTWRDRPPTPRQDRRTRLAEHHDADLAIASLRMAAATHGGHIAGVIFPSDRGSGYTSTAFGRACGRLGVTQSMGRVGSALDNAVAAATPP